MNRKKRRPHKDQPLDAIQLIDWFWQLFPKEQLKHTPESRWGACQCGTENLIARSRGNPNQMRTFLLVSVFIDQKVHKTLLYPKDYDRFRDRFRFPKLHSHSECSMASSSWLVYPRHGYDKKMDWEAARPVAKVLFVECLAYLQNELGVDYAFKGFLEFAEKGIREEFEEHPGQFLMEVIKEAVEEVNHPVPSEPNNEDEQPLLKF